MLLVIFDLLSSQFHMNGRGLQKQYIWNLGYEKYCCRVKHWVWVEMLLHCYVGSLVQFTSFSRQLWCKKFTIQQTANDMHLSIASCALILVMPSTSGFTLHNFTPEFQYTLVLSHEMIKSIFACSCDRLCKIMSL